MNFLTRLHRPARLTLAGLLLAVGLCGGSLAQTTPAPAAPTASHLAAAKDVLQASGISRSFGIFVPQIEDRLTQTLATTRPEIADDLALVLKQIEPEYKARQSEIIDQAAAAFARRMSEQELKDTAAFFNSASGKKYVDSQPAILDEIVNTIQNWTQKTSNDMMLRIRAEMKKKGHDI
jgi:uncharacterized protein